MQKLAKREEQIMQICWKLKKAFIKDIIQFMPDPRPHYNTVATLVKILEEKHFVEHENIGNVHRYYPLISKVEYQKHVVNDIINQYFDNSYPRMLAFFAKEEKISEEEVNEIIALIKNKKP
jgi:BlaI family penicillinase repressor